MPKSDRPLLKTLKDLSIKGNSFFYISFYDTVSKLKLKKIKDNNYKWVRGKVYPDIIAVNILPDSNRFFLDTTIATAQNKGVPSQCIEQNGKLFFWYDKQYPLTNNTIKLLDKYHRLWRGASINAEDHPFAINELAQSIQYYFCKSNLSVFKKVITNRAIGAYEPPNVTCK
ncbi:MAG TPA: hypothetical protein VK668_12225 [Mucilaginibacter sp.]|nr:hypothetical protein [Mucilaginibacter sp.]